MVGTKPPAAFLMSFMCAGCAAPTTFAMINFDMVGRLEENTLIAIGTGSATELPMLLGSLNAEAQFDLATQDDPWGRSDHSSFYSASIPVVH